MKKILTLIIFCIAALNVSNASVWNIENVPNVHLKDRMQYVSDPDGLLSDSAKNSINTTLRRLSDETSAEIVAVILNSTGDIPIEEFGVKLASHWGVGKSDKDNGAMFLLIMDQKAARIETGYGMEGILPDIVCKRILDNNLIPAMREGNIDKAVTSTVSEISKIVSNPEYAEEIKSQQREVTGGLNSINAEVLWMFVRGVAAVCFLLLLVIFISDMRTAKKRRTNYDKAMVWRRHLSLYFILALLSLGSGLLFAIPALLLYRGMRTRKVKCDTCGKKMNRLSEEEDNSLLDSAQDLEERLNTVDYDVWLCPNCGTIERFPFYVKQDKYKPCPHCGTIAYGLKYDKILRPATPDRSGVGEKVYECKHCGYTHSEKYNIPPDDSSGNAALLGILAAGALSGRGGGGGPMGGSFGGGGFGGGGATGRW